MLDEVLQDLSENHNQNYLFRCNQVALEWVEKFIFGDEVDEFAWYDMSVGQRSSLLSFLINAPCQFLGLKGEIGVNANISDSKGIIGPFADRL